MKVFLPWLDEYLSKKTESPEQIAERLTFAGVEVEGIETYGAWLDGVVVGTIRECRPHPDAERLHVCEVDDGRATATVVCGAPNSRAGIKVPYAPPGTRLPGGLVEERKIRGVQSSGMLLSAAELGLWDDHTGLLELETTCRAGQTMASVVETGAVLEVSATPNRPDVLSHVGVAREVAAITGRTLRLPKARLQENGRPVEQLASVRIDAPGPCARYVARVIEDVEVKQSPAWLRARLAAAGVRPINNIVDVTNYVLLELGHPLHAFDLDKLDQAMIVVRMAEDGEELQTLDGVARRLHHEDLVIADGSSAVALAGVMGGQGSEVTSGTTRILLESAWFEPVSVRRSARRHALHSESSHRFERGADPSMPPFAADRASALIREVSGGRVVAGAIDVRARTIAPPRVTLRHGRANELMGFQIPKHRQIGILTRLGFSVVEKCADRTLFEAPSFRTEMSREIDLIEEVARVQGYDAIPSTLPRRGPDLPPEADDALRARVVERLREAALAVGCREVVNYSFVPLDEAAAVVEPGATNRVEGRPLALSNPLSAEQGAMRTTLLVSLLSNLRHNRRFQRADLKLYEIGRVYLLGESGEIEEPERFGAVLTGRRQPVSWTEGPSEMDFYDVKGLFESSLQRVGLKVGDCSFSPARELLPWLHPRSACKVTGPNGDPLGWLGEVHPRLAAVFDLPAGVMALEIDLRELCGLAHLVPFYQTVPRFPPVLRDLAVVVDASVSARAVREALEAPLPEAQSLGVRVADVTLFDVYSGPQVGEGRRSMAFSIQYQASDRTLTDAETATVHQAAIARLQLEVGAKLRG